MLQEFEQAVLTLNHCGALAIKDGKVLVKQSINKHTTFFSQMFEPFLLGYWVSVNETCISPVAVSVSPLSDILKVRLLDIMKMKLYNESETVGYNENETV